MATKKTTTKTEAPTPNGNTPEITVESVLNSVTQGTDQARAAFLKQQGVKEFLESLRDQGYEIVKTEASD